MEINRREGVTIPVAVRKKTRLLPATAVEFIISGSEVVLREVPRRGPPGKEIIAHMPGRLKGKMSTDEIMTLMRG